MSSLLTDRRFLAMLLAVCAAAAGGCAAPRSSPARLEPPGRDVPVSLPLVRDLASEGAEWNRGVLQCADREAVDACGNWYRFTVPETGAVRIEVRAPVGPEVPDFDVRLEDLSGDVLWGFAPTGTSPRQIDRILDPGEYYLLVESVGERRGPLAYEVLARLDGLGSVLAGAAPPRPAVSAPPKTVAAPVARVRSVASLPSAASVQSAASAPSAPNTTSAPAVPEAWIGGEVLEVAPAEGSSGPAGSVVLDLGSRDSLRAGQRGELLVHGGVIATFEIVEVEERRSRARLDTPPPAAIPSGTRARVHVSVH